MIHTILHVVNAFMGTSDQNSWGYKFWSGFGMVISWVVGILLYYRKHKCHKCWRIGHHVPHSHYPVCKRHVLELEVHHG